MLPPPPPVFSSSCDAMQSIKEGLIDSLNMHCERRGCNSVHCSEGGYEFSLVLHCSEPLGFEIQVANETDTISHLFTESGTWNGYNVTVLNMMNKRLGLAVTNTINYNALSTEVTLITYTEVPVNSSACSGKTNVPNIV